MELDRVLLQQVEELCSGESVHLHANLAGAYRSAFEEYRRTGDEDYLAIAGEAEVALRIRVAKLRCERAMFVRWE